MSLLSRVIASFRAAGAPTEAASDRQGFLSYHAESHAVGIGLAAGWIAVTIGELQLVGVVYAAAVYGRVQALAEVGGEKRRKVVRDIAQEPHYALGGLVAGGVVGLVTRLVVLGSTPSLAGLADALPL